MQMFGVFICCLLGSMIQGATGFGFGIFVMAVLPLFLPASSAVAGVAIMSLVNCAMLLYSSRKSVKLKVLLIPAILSLPGRLLGNLVLQRLEGGSFETVLGVVLILLSVYFAFMKEPRIKPGPVPGTVAGVLSGVLGGAFNISGPPLVVYYMSALPDKDEYMGTIQATFFISGIYSVLIHSFSGRMTEDTLKIALAGTIAVLIGTRLGYKLFKYISRETLKKVVYIFMAIMGIVMVVGG